MRGRTQRTLLALSGCALGILSTIPTAHAQERATQAFTVRIPPKLGVTPPAPTATLSHDGTGQDQAFAAQRWTVSANSRSGASVTFSTDQAFTNTTNAAAKRDAQIELTVSSPAILAGWAAVVASDRTYYRDAAGDERATVRATSNGPGQASFEIVVTVLDDPNEPLEAGEYALTVVGTLTAN
jgi:hypothetical protein